MVLLKVTDGYETRKFLVTSELTFDQLKERLTGLFPSLGEGKNLQLQYRDTESDLITLSSNEELQEVLAHTPDGAVLKLHIKTSVQEPSLLDFFSEPFWRPFGLLSWHGFHQELREAEELIRQRRRQCERARTATQEKNKATDSKVQQETPTEPSKGSASPDVPADEVVKSKIPSGGHVVEHKPQWHCRAIGSWEPKIYDGLFGRRTVIGPVGYHMWWGTSDTGDEDQKKEAATEQRQQEPSKTQQSTASALWTVS